MNGLSLKLSKTPSTTLDLHFIYDDLEKGMSMWQSKPHESDSMQNLEK